jgi:two-component system phosphate regulon sensor histidine kinase PhoR
MPRIQQKIMGALAALVFLVVGLSAVLAEQRLRERRIDELVESLEARTQLVAAMAGRLDIPSEPNAAILEFARDAGRASHARVTLISLDGLVLADSALSLDEVRALDDHSNRPEFAEALTRGFGLSQRRSGTLKRELLYSAVPVSARAKTRTGDEQSVDPGGKGGASPGRAGDPAGAQSGDAANPVAVARLALDLQVVDAAIADLRRDLAIACLLGLVAALGISYLLSRMSLRPIQELGAAVADIAEGKLERRLHWEGALDERTAIATAINRMARQLRDRATQATHERDQFEAVLGAMAEGVLVIDNDHHVLHANPRLREMFDLWGPVEGRLAAEVVRSFEVNEMLEESLGRDDMVVGEVDILVPSERTVMVHAGRFPKLGDRVGTVAVLYDVTELRRVDRVRSDFIANASHELRTPLTAIRGFADTLVQSNLDRDEIGPYLEVIARNSQRMSDLVDDLLQLSRIESGKAVLEESEIDLVRICDLLLRDLGPRLDEAGLVAQLHCEEKEVLCWTDRQAIEQVITNLLTNAVRYTNAGGRIDVHLLPTEDSVEIRVADTGIGIQESDLQRIFERFYRVDASRSRVIGSTGLGLSIVRHLVRTLGGEVRVESQVGRGSTFSVRLPRSARQHENPTLFEHSDGRKRAGGDQRELGNL